jgi:hypothetical protein
MALTYEYGDKTVQEFVHLFNHGQLNLEPGFQRDSVWTLGDRKKLILSILQNYPVPSVFLYKNSEEGQLRYDVIDGKQRLEAILGFLGCKRGMRFAVRMHLGDSESLSDWDWRKLKHKKLADRIMAYKIQTVEVAGDLSDIVDLFVRINSTGKRLTGAEKRHAKYYHSPFLRRAGKLATRYERFFTENRILSPASISRMKHVELVCELMASIQTRGPINKKSALDDIIRGQGFDGRSLDRCTGEVVRTIHLVRRAIPELRTTRFANAVDFYSLFLLFWEMDQALCIFTDTRRNRQAQKLLVRLSYGVDEVRQQLRQAVGPKPDQRLFADYLLTVRGDTDGLANRRRRADLLKSVLGGLFEKKDERRGFTQDQRRLIWHSDETRKCPGCGERLSWANFTIDHIKPHSRGGTTSLSNAALMCRSCNARKGNRRRPH